MSHVVLDILSVIWKPGEDDCWSTKQSRSMVWELNQQIKGFSFFCFIYHIYLFFFSYNLFLLVLTSFWCCRQLVWKQLKLGGKPVLLRTTLVPETRHN